jgi:hypothetical protein
MGRGRGTLIFGSAGIRIGNKKRSLASGDLFDYPELASLSRDEELAQKG